MVFAGDFEPLDWTFCHGQLLQIDYSPMLFSVIGTAYGGDGTSTFAVPDLRGCTAVGVGVNNVVLGRRDGSPRVSAGTGTPGTLGLGLNWCISTLEAPQVRSDPFVGEISAFAGETAPPGWVLCHGQVFPISEYQQLFSVVGATYGGDGTATFALPDLQGRAPAGIGQGPGLPEMVLGQTGIFPMIAGPTSGDDNAGGVPYAGINWCIAMDGDFPFPD